MLKLVKSKKCRAELRKILNFRDKKSFFLYERDELLSLCCQLYPYQAPQFRCQFLSDDKKLGMTLREYKEWKKGWKKCQVKSEWLPFRYALEGRDAHRRQLVPRRLDWGPVPDEFNRRLAWATNPQLAARMTREVQTLQDSQDDDKSAGRSNTVLPEPSRSEDGAQDSSEDSWSSSDSASE